MKRLPWFLVFVCSVLCVALMGASKGTIRGGDPAVVLTTIAAGPTETCSTLSREITGFIIHNRTAHDTKVCFVAGCTASSYMTLLANTYWQADMYLKNGDVVCFNGTAADVVEMVTLQ